MNETEKTTELPLASVLNGADELLVNQAGVTKRVPADSAVVRTTGDQSIDGAKTFTSGLVVELPANAVALAATGPQGAGLTTTLSPFNNEANYLTQRANGSSIAPTPVLSGDILAAFTGRGWGGSTYGLGVGRMQVVADGDFSEVSKPARMEFQTTPVGSTTRVSRWAIANDGHFLPVTDNTYNLGSGSFRAGTIFAATGTINTSDEREKQWRGDLSPSELAAAKRIGQEIGAFKFLDAIAKKGQDAARTHIGVKAQAVRDILIDEGLDPHAYGFLCYDEWAATPEITTHSNDGSHTIPALAAGNRWGIRYDELVAFLLAAMEQRLAILEAV